MLAVRESMPCSTRGLPQRSWPYTLVLKPDYILCRAMRVLPVSASQGVTGECWLSERACHTPPEGFRSAAGPHRSAHLRSP